MMLLSWGANSHGQLGQNLVSEVCCVPSEVNLDAYIDPTSITSIVGGGGHTLILDSGGRVFSCGWNNKGQLGISGGDHKVFQMIQGLQGHRISQIACGWDSSLAVTADGCIFVWGSNIHCQLGQSKLKVRCTDVPQLLPLSRVKQASLGLRHLALVTDDGKVLVSGNGRKGQLGIMDSTRQPCLELPSLTQVPGLDNITHISCGQHHNIAISESGKVYVWGDNKFGQLGLDINARPVVHSPEELSLSSVSGVNGNPLLALAGWTHSVTLTDKRELINWGRDNYGQLGGRNTDEAASWKPCLLDICEKINDIAVGSEHNLVLTEKGDIISWGWNEHGNCGTGNQENVLKPSFVKFRQREKATIIGSGACHCFAILKSKG